MQENVLTSRYNDWQRKGYDGLSDELKQEFKPPKVNQHAYHNGNTGQPQYPLEQWENKQSNKYKNDDQF